MVSEFSVVSLELLGRFVGEETVNVGEFCDGIRRFDVFQTLGKMEVRAEVLREFVYCEVGEVLREQPANLEKVIGMSR